MKLLNNHIRKLVPREKALPSTQFSEWQNIYTKHINEKSQNTVDKRKTARVFGQEK